MTDETVENKINVLEKQVAVLMEFKAKVERRHRLKSLYSLLVQAADAVWLNKEFEGSQPGFYCAYCLKEQETLIPLQQLKKESFLSAVFHTCPKCGQKANVDGYEANPVSPPVSPPDDI